MADSKFAIGQRVRVVRVGDWNGTPPDGELWRALVGCPFGTVVKPSGYDTIAVEIDEGVLGVLQFLPDELEVIE